MVVLVTGASGFLGRAVAKSYLSDGAVVHVIGRDARTLRALYGDRARIFTWDPAEGEFPERALDGVDAVFHLMGEPVGGRWTKRKKSRIITSRVTAAQMIGRAMSGRAARLISASSFGIYPGKRGETYTEASKIDGQARSFIRSTLRAWENAALAASGGETKVSVIRFGMVCAPDGYPKRLVRLFGRVGGLIVGDGEQIVPLVDLDDAVRMMRWAAEGGAGEGIINCVSPNLPRFREVAETIAGVLRKPIRGTIPEWLARPLLGGSADYFLLSYDIRPVRALEQGFTFAHDQPSDILRRALAPYAVRS
ncbi:MULTISPECIES: NAD-dependent epimerase/dehydratase family protein [Rhodomicrobium]|uniref:NAD-dependent epimerase/dehydratase family protein n=1 Tax=Rhodomicrobium TaxID=1068 RepID=UPI000B4BC7E9|nr:MULTISPECIES: NAD-dependent epimerase/dehydratase family protein [Rhodomicrobium]